MRRALRQTLSVGLVLAAIGCGDATGILVEVTSPDLTVPDDIDGLRFAVTTTSGRSLDRSYPVESAWPHSLTVLPGPDQDGAVTITVTGLLAGAPVVSRTVVSSFIAGTTRVVVVTLEGDCVGVMCPPGQECAAGMCRELPRDGGVDGGRTDGGVVDGGRIDGGGIDGGVDAGVDGGRTDAGRLDGGRDAGFDAGRDAGVDGGFDAGIDAGPPVPPNLLLSEYVEGDMSNKAIEILNAGTGTANLAGCLLRRYANGATTPTNIALSGSLAPGTVYVVCNGAIDPTAPCDQTTATISHNGDDAYDLACGGTVLDTFGRIGEDPGVEWSGGGLSTVDFVLKRRCSITMGDPVGSDPFDPSVEWTGAAWVPLPSASLSGLGNRAECP